MKFTKILPYFLFGTLSIVPNKVGDSCNTIDSAPKKVNIARDIASTSYTPSQKAKELCDTYIDFVLQGQKNIRQSTSTYKNAVLAELPDAPVGWHCIYGQYTQLNRALQELGDTLTLIPRNGRNACGYFRDAMRKKYSDTKYAGALHNGKLMNPRAYASALSAFLRRHHVTDETPDSVRQSVIARFNKHNFSIDSLHPGTILIIQRAENSDNAHAVMFLGRGHVQNDVFVPDSGGEFMYAGYNHESVGNVFTTYNTDHVFAADIYDIALVAYKEDLEKQQAKFDKDIYAYPTHQIKTNKPTPSPRKEQPATFCGIGPLYLVSRFVIEK